MLMREDAGEGDSIETSLRFSLRSHTFRLILGILSAVIGVLKLLSPSMDTMPILGDLLPALGGIAAGFVLVFGWYREQSSPVFEGEGRLDRFGDAFMKYRKGAGLTLLVVAGLHFLFPQAFLL